MDQTPEAVWNACLDVIRDNISRQSFKTWFGPLKAVSLEQEGEHAKLTIQLPSRFYYEWLEEHYFTLLRKTITKVLGPNGRLFYKIVIEKDDAETGYEGTSMQLPAQPDGRAEAPRPQPVSPRPSHGASPSGGRPAQPRHEPRPVGVGGGGRSPSPAPSPVGMSQPPASPFVIPGIQKTPVESNLNPGYVFERFIEGDCNRLARSAAHAIAQQPGTTSFNPFLVYGGVGLGKTHLIQAIGNYARAQRKIETVLYVSSERFTAEFVQSIKHNRAAEFSLFYRNIDLLIVDDIQFFEGKEKTQEEFFHIFNALHQSGKQIVLSSDRSPRDIQGIEERLLSRFSWGLSADMQPPELETRIAILQRKAEDDGIEMDQEVIEFVAHNVKSNIRELEGALIRLLAHSTLHKRELDLALAKEVLRDLIKDVRVNLTVEEIQRIVAEYFRINEDLLLAKTRKREIVQARQVAMFFCREFTGKPYGSIGKHFGGRDHSTVLHAMESVNAQLDTDPKFRETVEELRHKIELRSR